jgi:hypothetical protein
VARSNRFNRKRHAIRRAYERYGVKLTSQDYEALNAEAAKLARGKSRQVVVRFCWRRMLAAWDRDANQIVTFLPHKRPAAG